ncbi:hypothetical protein [Paenibacillus qinlingensis]|uniref:Uncharacterized protein n=1 Tax=Paenibacillus qinlingensis TaxID=1837343 RepID=A0ABU1NRA1_9BACL|nr:hypothetical protein [Paenibacillus qinlingensis]MDR6549999.1 hypothetical protein [Paenibacillus qinlingensis]
MGDIRWFDVSSLAVESAEALLQHEVSLRAKGHLGLIGQHGEDYTLTMTDPACKELIQQGVFQDELEFPKWTGPIGILQKGAK